MKLTELATFEVAHAHIAWPWIAFDATDHRFAFSSSRERIATRVLAGGNVSEGPDFTAPSELSLRAFALDTSGARLALIGALAGASVVVVVVASGASADSGGDVAQQRAPLESLAGAGFTAQAIAFDRSGERLWISAESATETALLLVDARTLAPLGVVKSAAFPPPSTHELMLAPGDDAILLLAACGEDGTFARVARWSQGRLEGVPTALDVGSIPAGFVGFSSDGARVHLAEADELRTHAWPGLVELSSVELTDDFVSSFAGANLDGRILVDGEDSEAHEDAVLIFDASALRGTLAPPPVPAGMWAGRLGRDTLVTVEAKGEPARGRVIRIGQ